MNVHDSLAASGNRQTWEREAHPSGSSLHGGRALLLRTVWIAGALLAVVLFSAGISQHIEASRRIHRASPHIGILVLTMFEDDTSVFPAIRAGARGYLLKDADQAELLHAIQTVAKGGVIFSAAIAQHVLQYLSAPQPAEPKVPAFDELTPREREILQLIAHGHTNAEIAEQLNLSPKTVSNNVSNVLLKLQAADRAKLMLMALEAGLGQSGKG